MSVRLLTTALILLMQSAGQKPADVPQDPTLTCTPDAEVIYTSDGPITLQNLLVQVEEAPTGSLLFGVGVNSDAGITGALVQETQHQNDVFPLYRLADPEVQVWTGYIEEEATAVKQANHVEPQRCSMCKRVSLMVLHQVCPPLRFCPACRLDHDPCLEMMGCVVRKCSGWWSGSVVQAGAIHMPVSRFRAQRHVEEKPCETQTPSHCGKGCWYPYSQWDHPVAVEEECETTLEEPCQLSRPIEDCSAAQAEELDVMPCEVECFEKACTCCKDKCECKEQCACGTEAKTCSCCNEKCCCSKGACSTECGKKGQCGAGKCCKDGECGKVAQKINKVCAAMCGISCRTAAKAEAKAKCKCSECAKSEKCCCEGECGCKEGACKCGKTFQAKKGQCKCSSECAASEKCCCEGECGCKEGACKCKKTFQARHEGKQCQASGCGQAATYNDKTECPYLKAKEAQAKIKTPVEHDVTPLENLAKLMQARALCQQAEKLQQAGMVGMAEHCYRKAQKVAPGSRYDGLAQSALTAIQEQKSLAKLSILDKARLALKEGKIDEAYQLAEQAYGEAYSVMSKASALLRVINLERYQIGIEEPSEEPKSCEEPSEEPCQEPLPCEGPSGHYIQRAPQYIPPSPPFPLQRELATMEREDTRKGVMMAPKLTMEPCQEPLPCEPQTYVPDCVPIAVEVKVAEYLEACQRALAAGCFSEALTYAEQALQLDPCCGAARLLASKAKEMVRYEEEQQEEKDSCVPDEKGEEPCEIDPEGAVMYPVMPPIDPAIAAVLQRILIESDENLNQAGCAEPCQEKEKQCGKHGKHCGKHEEAASERLLKRAVKLKQDADKSGEAEEQEIYMPRDWQLLELYIDPEECDGYSPPNTGSEAQDQEPPLADAGELFRQLVQAVSGGNCIEVNTGNQGPRVWIQLGAAHCHWSASGSGTISFVPPCPQEEVCDEEAGYQCLTGSAPAACEAAGSAASVKVQIGGPCEISIHIKWGGSPVVERVHGGITPGAGGLDLDECGNVKDLRDKQANHEQEVLRWIESMNSGDVDQCETPCTDVDEDEDVNVDPCDG